MRKNEKWTGERRQDKGNNDRECKEESRKEGMTEHKKTAMFGCVLSMHICIVQQLNRALKYGIGKN